MPKLKIVASLIFSLLLVQAVGCSLLNEDNFAIVLADTGQTVLTERDVAAYHIDGTLELNAGGIKKWNSHLYYPDIPKLADTLYQQDFIIKIDGKEVCRGKFWSAASSATIDGIIILDSLFKLEDNHNSIQLRAAYPFGGLLPDSIASQLERFFDNRHLLN